ncbi:MULTISPECIES: ABC transporter ATP-binding protein [unclassified Bradyrhizobium]|uniref:ABC transporter ATP-binding protein n=1 Tax=unclassified Bradyrhizobium TaxID=2631580 RepID=UPI00244AD932|nr:MULTISPECIES: ABC transporter ATP-binding protein [unclassified Bradyrhizobium]MDH2344061.1 ABC transporter ATP-binding protein [Bradyrhizobium sp. SSUT77]MDH2350346.1 ABC transporter ATP-binding protein [Bradyrhizobium sp. SSUT112]
MPAPAAFVPADGSVNSAAAPLLEVENLRVSFGRGPQQVAAVKGVSFKLEQGRCLAIVGESGSGKSVTARSLVGLPGLRGMVHADRLVFAGRELNKLSNRAWRAFRGKDIGFVLQDALVSLDPLRPVGEEIAEGLRLHGELRSRVERERRVIDLLKLVGVPDPELKARQLPQQLSGGQRQRALIASALSLDPRLLIADEPTTALDVTIQAQVLASLEETRARGKALILISHDLAVVSRMADEVLVMRDGEVVERGPAAQVFSDPRHEYTRRLIDAIPSTHSRGSRLAPSSTPRFSPSHVDNRAAEAQGLDVLLRADGLVKRFKGPDGTLHTAVDNVSFELRRGETLGIVGESGSGKSTVARLAMALEAPDEGAVELLGESWSALPEAKRRGNRRAISIVYQDPLSSFDPRWSVAQIVDDALPDDEPDRRGRIAELFALVGFPVSLAHRRPLELSGGQRQRLAIARAVAPRPRVIVCDEPVSALDVSIQAQVLDLLGDLKATLGVSYLFISHDLGVVHHISDRVLVMNQGRVVESGEADEIFLNPRAEYTKRLVAAVPRLVRGEAANRSFSRVEGGSA